MISLHITELLALVKDVFTVGCCLASITVVCLLVINELKHKIF